MPALARRTRPPAVALVAFALAGAACGEQAQRPVREGGPLTTGAGDGVSSVALPGGQFVDGFTVVRNEGKEDAVLEGIEPALSGVAVRLRTYAAGADRGGPQDLGGTTWPPELTVPESIRPLSGTRVPPSSSKSGKRGAQILLRFDLPAEGGLVDLNGYVLRYRVGKQRYRVRVEHTSRICVTPDTKADCPLPADRG